MRPLLLGFLLATSACFAPPTDDADAESTSIDEADLVTIDPDRPIAVHFGYLQRVRNGRNDADGARTRRLRAPNVENVVVGSRPPSDPEARAWGGRLARHLPASVPAEPNRKDTLVANLADFPAFVRARVAEGFAYVAIDELEPTKSAFLRDDDPRSDRFVAALQAMDADPMLRRRVILLVNSYNMSGPNFDELAQFSKVLRACRDTCRVVGAEMYLGTGEAFGRGAATARTPREKGGCANGVDCMGYVVNKLERVAPGIRKRTITILGVSDDYKPARNEESYCGGRGAIRAEMAKVRELRQPGVGTYSLASVANDATRETFDAKQTAFATCLRAQVQSTNFPRFQR